jgi:hypothetical protein
MRRQFIATAWMVGALVCGRVTGSLADTPDPHPGSRGVVVTVTAIDPHTEMATLKTQDGAQYQRVAAASWQVGAQMLCDLREPSLRPEERLQHCRPWQ